MTDFATKTQILTLDKLLAFDTVIAFLISSRSAYSTRTAIVLRTSWSRIERNVMGFVLVTRHLRMAVYTA